MQKFLISFILILCFVTYGKAQQYSIYSQYIFNEFIINPSVAGVDGMTTINITGRKQWAGFPNSPETFSASASTRILKSPFQIESGKVKEKTQGRVGLGVVLSSDRNGAINRTNLQIAYAYHIFILNTQLSLGLSANATQFRIDGKLAELKDPDYDRLSGVVGQSTYIPDASAGVSLSALKSQFGFSVNQLFQSPVKLGDTYVNSKDIQQIRQYNLYGVHRFIIKSNTNWEFEPSAIIRGNERLQFSSDITGRFVYKREYWVGLSYRTSEEFILFAGLKINRIYFGYSFDYGFNEISRITYGSHEIVLALKFGDSTRRYRWLERY